MSERFAELDHAITPMGPLVLRRRLEPTVQQVVYEVKLGEEFLMSSLFTVSERELARRGLEWCPGEELDVLVGGLGLGYTACEVLTSDRVGSLRVVEALQPVIDWHRRGLLPDAAGLADDPRVRLDCDDFFALVGQGAHRPDDGHRRYDAVLVDIDHTPEHLLHPSHGRFYDRDGLRGLAGILTSDGVFGLWSDDPADDELLARLRTVFTEVTAPRISFANPLTRGESACTVYLARGPRTD